MNAKIRIFSLLVVIALFVSACAPQAAATPAQPAVAQAAAPTAAPTATSALAGAQVNLGNDASLGTFLVDNKGMTLYLYTKDTPDTSVCYDSCAQKWPPLLTKGAPVAGEGVDAALLGTTERKDGALQVTYKGQPLYYWWKDKQAGDTLGQDVGGVWYVLSPAGELIKTVSAEPTAAPTAEPTIVAAASASGEIEIEVENNDTLGPILVDSKGMTLYLFTKDSPNTSVCYDTCAQNWPPLLAAGELKAGDGVDGARLSTIQRTDGSLQVTYNGWPLYYYAKDAQPGDTQGQEVGSVWFVITPAGEMVKSSSY